MKVRTAQDLFLQLAALSEEERALLPLLVEQKEEEDLPFNDDEDEDGEEEIDESHLEDGDITAEVLFGNFVITGIGGWERSF